MVSSSRQSEYYSRHSREEPRTLGNYSRRLQDYSSIRWSTFQPRDASSTLEDFCPPKLAKSRGIEEIPPRTPLTL
jgi:hypothetical protein